MGCQVREFVVDGEPHGKGRPKFSSRGRFVHVYTPKETVDYEQKVREAYGDKPMMDTKPLKVVINAYYRIPKSLSKKDYQKALLKEKRPLTKPDVDNVSKSILDALNGVAYEDDKQVVSLIINKFYSDVPRVEVQIYAV